MAAKKEKSDVNEALAGIASTDVESLTDPIESFFEDKGTEPEPIPEAEPAKPKAKTKKTTEEPEEENPLLDIKDVLENVIPTGGNGEESEEEEGDTSPSPGEGKGIKYSTATLIAKAFIDENDIPSDFNPDEFEKVAKEKGTAKALLEFVHARVLDGIGGYKNSLSEEQRDYLEAIEKGINPREYAEVKSQKIEYGKITEDKVSEDEKLQKKLIADILHLRGFDDEEIKEEIEGYEDSGKLEGKAKKALGLLKEWSKQHEEQIKKDTDERIKIEKKRWNDHIDFVKTDINKTDELIPSVKVTPKLKEKWIESMTVPVARHPETGELLDAVRVKMLQHPYEMKKILHYLNLIGTFNFDDKGRYTPKFDVVQKAMTSKTVSDLDRLIEESHSNYRGSVKSTTGEKKFEDNIKAISEIGKQLRL